jgi:hypothetical protein
MATIKNCLHCNEEFSIYYIENGIKKHSDKRKFCYKCSPIGSHNTKHSLIKTIKIEKECTCCHTVKPIGEYYKNQGKCKVCHNNKVLEGQRELKQKCVDYLGGKCNICGYDKYIGALDFHHVDPDEKEFSISGAKRLLFENLKDELDKCILVCSNCHREIHGKIINIDN